MKLARAVLAAAALAIALPVSLDPGCAQDQITVHRMAAAQYEVPGLVEEAVAEWIEVLALSPDDAEARAHVDALVRKQMPVWLPEEAERTAPFKCDALRWDIPISAGPVVPSVPAGSGAALQCRFLVTSVDFPAREGERWDELHETGFSHIDYGYAWTQAKRRYEARVVVHWDDPAQAALAHNALKATLIYYALAREQLGFDPTRPWGDPVDIWITNKGQPGARAQGRSIYLYAAKTDRAPAEWLRELAHEYGHVCLPGIDGFTGADDAWADGHLAELLFPKWLATASAPEWSPWPAADWEAEAAAERAKLMEPWAADEVKAMIGKASGPLPPLLSGDDAKARDLFLGLALRVEDIRGPRFLADVLKKCPRGAATQFAKSLGRMR